MDKNLEVILKKLLIGLLGLGLAINAFGMEKPAKNTQNSTIPENSAMHYIKAGASQYLTAYKTAFAHSFIHEFGHWITQKTAGKGYGIIWINPFQILPLSGAMLRSNIPFSQILKEAMNIKGTITQEKIDAIMAKSTPKKIGVPAAIISAAGPFFGLLGCYAMLKGNTIQNEYENNGNNLEQAYKAAQHKSLVNKDQNLSVQLITIYAFLSNFLNLCPMPDLKGDNDGTKIFQALKLKPQHALKTARYAVKGLPVLAGLCGYALYDAHRDTIGELVKSVKQKIDKV